MCSTGIHCIRFSQDNGLFSCSTENGLCIYNTEPLLRKAFIGQDIMGSVAMAEVLHRSNFIAVVGGGSHPKFASNTVLIWDDYEKVFKMELTFAQPVVGVRMRKYKLLVVLRNQVHEFSFPSNPKKLATFETRDNPRGLCEVNAGSDREVLVFPGHKCGSLQLVDLASTEPSSSSSPVTINAHENELACIAINHQGDLVATASKKGTLIRVFDTNSRRQVIELRRGADQATLYCLNFSPNSEFLCSSSDKGTVHIFAIQNANLNKTSSFKKMGFLGPYVESQWGLASFTVPAECACICAFGQQKSVIAICVDGTFHKYVFSPEGNCNREEYAVYLDMANDDPF